MLHRLVILASLLSALLGCGSKPSSALKGDGAVTGGNNGDERRVLFSRMRGVAEGFTRRFDGALFDELLSRGDVTSQNSARVRAFLVEHHVELADEISAVDHKWVQSGQESCASTGSNLGDPIIFSFARCEAGAITEPGSEHKITKVDEAFASMLLIHEAVHHFGVGNSARDESFADSIALVLYQMSSQLIISNYWVGATAYGVQEVQTSFERACGALSQMLQGHYRIADASIKFVSFHCGEPKLIKHYKDSTVASMIGNGRLVLSLQTPFFNVTQGSTILGQANVVGDAYENWRERCDQEMLSHSLDEKFIAIDCQEPKNIGDERDIVFSSITKVYSRR